MMRIGERAPCVERTSWTLEMDVWLGRNVQRPAGLHNVTPRQNKEATEGRETLRRKQKPKTGCWAVRLRCSGVQPPPFSSPPRCLGPLVCWQPVQTGEPCTGPQTLLPPPLHFLCISCSVSSPNCKDQHEDPNITCHFCLPSCHSGV